MQTRPLKQKVIGILGGCSDVATVEYYKAINHLVNQHLGGWEIAETVIVGMNFGNIEAMIREDSWDLIENYLLEKVTSLKNAGADIVICASNTLHRSLEGVAEKVAIELIHIADPTGDAIKAQGLQKIALFGTKPVMEMQYLSQRYKDRFGIEIIVPTEVEQIEIDRIIFEELTKGKFLAESKSAYLKIFDRLVEQDGVQGLILGCTEIFLLIDQQDRPSYPMFNTGLLHCKSAVNWVLNDRLVK